MKQTLILLLLVLLHAWNAHAVEREDPTPVAFGELQLLGKGWEDRESGDLLALACTQKERNPGQACEQFRFVHYQQRTQEATLIGQTLKVHVLNTPADLQAWNREFKKSFRKWNYRTNVQKDFMLYGTAAPMTAGLLYFSLAANGAIVGSAGVLVGMVFIPAFLVVGVNTLHTFGVYNALRSGDTSAVINQNGWNWSVKPMKIGNKKFEKFLKFINGAHSEVSQSTI